jgi:hypothetical protein
MTAPGGVYAARNAKAHHLEPDSMIKNSFASGAVRLLRLKYLSLSKIVDVAYLCGCDNTPVSLLIATPPGAGKTYATKSLQNVDFVQYLNHVYSPNEHRAIIASKAARTRLLINDDLGLAARWNQKEFFSTFIMVADGEISFTQWRQNQHAILNCSLVLLCTLDYYTTNRNDMAGMGLYDRVIPIVAGLSQETRRSYQDSIRLHRSTRNPPNREPYQPEKGEFKDDLIEKKDIDPRLLQNLTYMSAWMTDNEFAELVSIAHEQDKYEV